MSAEISFISQIAKIKRRLIIQAVHGILLHTALFFFSISALLLILTKGGISDTHIDARWYLISMAVSLSASLFICLLKRRPLLDVLIAMDRRLKLQDRLSTAYEYLKFKKKTEFTDLLMNDAAINLGQISNRQLVPARISWIHLLAFILLIINIFLYSAIFNPTDFKATQHQSKIIDNAAKLVNNYSISRIENNSVRKSNSHSVQAQKLKQLGNQLSDGSKSFEQRFAALNRHLTEVQGEQTRLASELSAKLDSAGIKELPMEKLPDPTKLSSSQLEKLKKLLTKTLNHRMADAIGQHIESLQELDRIEKLLGRIMDDLSDGRSLSDDITGTAVKERQTSQSTNLPDGPSDAPNRSPSDENFSEQRRIAVKQNPHPESGEMQRIEDDLLEGMGQPEGNSASAGRGRSEEEKKSSYDLENSPGFPRQDKVTPSPAKGYLIQIRALTDTGDARLNEEEILQTYRKAVESVLQKEDIPLNYREYIKNYFLSIGINTEETPHESK